MLFSIIAVTRNNLGGLRRTCDSLKQQNFSGFEHIIVDGASGDGTAAFLHASGIPFISEPDNGIYDAMNKGIDRATGFYLIFLNAGDALASNTTLEELAAYIQDLQETPDFIYGDALEERPGLAPAYKPARPYAKSAYGMFTHHQAMLYRSDLLNGLRYDQSYHIAADYKFTLEFLALAKMIVYCPFPLCRFAPGGVSQQRAALGRREQFRIRGELQTVAPWQNRFISLQQKLVWALRAASPALYWALKSGQKKAPREGGASP